MVQLNPRGVKYTAGKLLFGFVAALGRLPAAAKGGAEPCWGGGQGF